MTRRLEVGTHFRELKATHPLAPREVLPLHRTGVARDPRDPVPPRPELQLCDGTARWCGHCFERRIAHYENFALRCGACGYATSPLNADDMRELIQVVLEELSVDEIKSMAEGALLKVWAQRTALANTSGQLAIREDRDTPPLYPTAPLPLPGAAARAPRQRTAVQRFWAMVDITDSCWIWRGGKDTKGIPRYDYGKATGQKRKAVYAHRVAWEIERQPLHGATRL